MRNARRFPRLWCSPFVVPRLLFEAVFIESLLVMLTVVLFYYNDGCRVLVKE